MMKVYGIFVNCGCCLEWYYLDCIEIVDGIILVEFDWLNLCCFLWVLE